MKLSCCIIMKNEEDRIEACLRSMKKYADEVIVVDNGSEDKSYKIAEKYADKIFCCNNQDMDANRNLYILEATMPWILVLDADEFILEEDGIKIKEYLDTAEENCYGITLNRFEYLGDGQWASIKILRLFRNDKRIFYNKGKIHTSVRYSINQLGGEFGNIDRAIHHFDILIKNRTSSKRENYVNTIKSELVNASNDYKKALNNYLATEYIALEKYDCAAELLRETLDGKKNIKKGEVGQPMTMVYLTQCLIKMGKLDEAFEIANGILEIDGLDKDFYERAYFLKSEIFCRKGKYKQAIELTEKLIEINPTAAHYHINLASLFLNENMEVVLENIVKAIVLNKNILNPAIYGSGEKPNIFEHQSSFLSSTENVIKIFKKALDL